MHRLGMLWLVLAGCNVEALGGDTGGVRPGKGGACPDGITVVLSDYRSTQIALSSVDGVTESASFVSTASAGTRGLSFALSGDVVLPSMRPRSGRVVLIDRFGTNVLTWLDPTTARVLGQLPVGTGFQSNPQDYVEVDAARAYVTRHGDNQLSGREPFDAGSDVLVIDTLVPEILGRIALPTSPDILPRPGGFARLDEQTVAVTLGRLSRDLQSNAVSMLVGIDTTNDEIVFQLELDGLENCGTPLLGPDARTLAIACTGPITSDGDSQDLEASGVLVLDTTERPPRLTSHFSARTIAGEALQSELSFVTSELLLVKTQTALGAASKNRLLALSLTDGRAETVFTSSDGGIGRGLSLGSILCAPGCSDTCLVADSGASVLQRFRATTDGALDYTDAVPVEGRVGLPPVELTYR